MTPRSIQSSCLKDREGEIIARDPKPLDPGKPSIVKLPDDTIIQIISLLQDVSPKSVLNLTYVSSYFYAKARYFRHREMAINLDKQDAGERIEFLSSSSLLLAVRSLHVSRQARSNDQSDSRVPSLLGDLIPKMTGLRDIHWRRPIIPVEVLECLKQCPLVRLHVLVSTRQSRGLQAIELLDGLVGSRNLFAVRAEVEYTATKGCLDITGRMKQLLISCPNLRQLKLDIGQPRGGCVVYGPSPEYVGFGLSKGESPPPLEELDIIRYPWGYGRGTHSFENKVGYPEDGTEMDYWANNFDWSQLHRIHEDYFWFSEKLVPKLVSLKEVKFTNGNRRTTMQRFFEELPSQLESISIPSLGSAGAAAITRHASTLRRLEIHRKELWNKEWSDELMTKGDLVTLRDSLPLLGDLTIDIARADGHWPHDMLNTLATFPRVKSLKLWFDICTARGKEPPRPYITVASASQLFIHIRKRCSTQPATLRRLHVCSGAPPPVEGGFFSEEAYWPESNSTSFICEVSERDDDAVQGVFTTTCPKLSEELNAKLERITSGEEQRSIPETDAVDFKVALDGPLPVQEWLDLRRAEQFAASSLTPYI